MLTASQFVTHLKLLLTSSYVDHLGAGAPEREKFTDRQPCAEQFLNENQEKVTSGRPDTLHLLPGSV